MLKTPEMYAEELRRISMLQPSSQQKAETHLSHRREHFHLLKQLTRFGLVGGLNTLIDILALNVLLLLGPTSSTLQILAYGVGAGNSFVCNKYWTFKRRQRDLACAFKLFHTSFLHDYPLETRGAMINAELLYRLKQGHFTQREVGVPHLPRLGGRATGARLSVIARALRDLFVYTHRWKRAEKVRARHTGAANRQHV
jgi:hypothetical protein